MLKLKIKSFSASLAFQCRTKIVLA